MKKIIKVIDKYFEFMQEINGNSFIAELIPESMINEKRKSQFDGILHWNAIPSTVTDEEILQLEIYYRHNLPESYITFLKHRHFIELLLGSYSIGFFKNLPNSLVEDTKEEIENYYLKLIEKNYLPFANMSDWGVLCFDANELRNKNDYPIVSFDNEDGYQRVKEFSLNFESMFHDFENHLHDWINSQREKKTAT